MPQNCWFFGKVSSIFVFGDVYDQRGTSDSVFCCVSVFLCMMDLVVVNSCLCILIDCKRESLMSSRTHSMVIARSGILLAILPPCGVRMVGGCVERGIWKYRVCIINELFVVINTSERES